MKKSDLRTGMWVKFRTGEVVMVLLNAINKCREGDILTNGKRWGSLEKYTDDLIHSEVIGLDIVEVLIAQRTWDISVFSKDNFDCIWEREETCHLTQSEAERILSETLGKKVEIKGGENALYRV